jgi:hypothetical protein
MDKGFALFDKRNVSASVQVASDLPAYVTATDDNDARLACSVL